MSAANNIEDCAGRPYDDNDMPTADGSENECTLESDQHETPVMEQWCHSYSGYSDSSGSSGSDDSGDREHEAYQALIRSAHDTATQTGNTSRAPTITGEPALTGEGLAPTVEDLAITFGEASWSITSPEISPDTPSHHVQTQPQQPEHQPTATRHDGPGMPPGGNNTTASEYQDIEHQPGPREDKLPCMSSEGYDKHQGKKHKKLKTTTPKVELKQQSK